MLEIADRVIDGIKSVRDIARKLENAELNNRIADLINASADLKLELADLKVEIGRVKSENERLKYAADLRTDLQRKDGALYLNGNHPEYGPGPFCIRCYEENKLLMNIHPDDGQYWWCDRCRRSVKMT
jgi:hypothetical protein